MCFRNLELTDLFIYFLANEVNFLMEIRQNIIQKSIHCGKPYRVRCFPILFVALILLHTEYVFIWSYDTDFICHSL